MGSGHNVGSIAAPLFNASTPEEAIASWVASCQPTAPARAALAGLLPEQHPLYTGRSTNATARIRGYALAAFERIGLPDAALPYVLDELQNGHEAYLVAAAAKALRGASSPAAVAFAAPFLEAARDNMRYADAPVSFDVYKPRRPVERSTTAAEEIRATIAWLGDADCCALPVPPRAPRRTLALNDVALEDQDGARTTFGSFFTGKPSVVAFFYSRCDNVRKCSLTVTKLAALQRALAARGLAGRVRLSAITYDPGFDLPARLALYGRERGVTFGEDVRFFRVPSGFDEVRSAFDLGVNYTGAIVNRHRIELYVLDRRGRIAASFTRLTWNDDEVVARLERLLRAPSWPGIAGAVPAAVASALIVLLPKCPLCLWAYASALGVTGLQLAPHRAWLLPAALVLVLAHMMMMGRRAVRARRLLPLCVSAAGTLALIAGTIVWTLPLLSAAGAAMTIAGAVMNAMPQGVDAGTVKPTTRRIVPSAFVRT
jgi:protein SCO1